MGKSSRVKLILFIVLFSSCQNTHETRLERRAQEKDREYFTSNTIVEKDTNSLSDSKLQRLERRKNQKYQNHNVESRSIYTDNKTSRQIHVEKVKVLTWNIENFGASLSNSQIDTIAELLKSYDLVAIQEISGKDPRAAQKIALLNDYLNRKGKKWDYEISDPTSDENSYRKERYAFFWNDSKIKERSQGNLIEILDFKVVREPFIKNFVVKGVPITLVNFHSIPFDQNPEIEIDEIIKYIISNHHDDNLIWCGDFNLTAQHSVFEALIDSGYKGAIIDKKTTLKRLCKNNNYFGHSIDNIYFSNAFKIVNSDVVDFVKNCDNLDEMRRISDHLPVYVELEIYK